MGKRTTFALLLITFVGLIIGWNRNKSPSHPQTTEGRADTNSVQTGGNLENNEHEGSVRVSPRVTAGALDGYEEIQF